MILPITLERDDLTVTQHGKTRGGFEYVCFENAPLVAAVVAERRQRQMVRDMNWRRWG